MITFHRNVARIEAIQYHKDMTVEDRKQILEWMEQPESGIINVQFQRDRFTFSGRRGVFVAYPGDFIMREATGYLYVRGQAELKSLYTELEPIRG